MPISLLIADDHAIVREGLRKFIELEPDFKIVGEAATGEETVKLAAKVNPQIVIMDLSMPGEGGIAATAKLTRLLPKVKVLVLTMHEDVCYLLEAIRVGACGFLLKDQDPKQIVQAIRIVAQEGAYMSPRMLAELFVELSRLLNKQVVGRKEGWEMMTERERQILSMISDGKTNAEIAVALVISPLTVKNHVSNILHKLGLADRTQAALFAQKMHSSQKDN